jgi:ParB family chromosome partitioning protein
MNDFISIPIGNIYAHPKNPRKELGELSELTASIEERGILQPLVVVPLPEDPLIETDPDAAIGHERETYTVVCGHRRLAAARFAGLTAVKCIVSDMTERDQITAMLLENIQRSNLTPIEEADGFQMMLDLGDDFSAISRSTGVSETTIRRRVKLLDLDRDKLTASLNKGATLYQYAQVLELEDGEVRNKVLDALGTDNFNFEIRRQKEIERGRKEGAEFAAEIAQKFTFRERDEISGLVFLKSVSIYNRKDIPGEGSGAKYYTKALYGNSFEIYRDKTPQDDEKKVREEQKRAAEGALRQEHEELRQLAYDNRRAFIASLREQALKKKADVLMREMLTVFLNSPVYGTSLDYEDLSHALEIDEAEREEMTDEEYETELYKHAKNCPHRTQAALIYALSGDSVNECYYDPSNCVYRGNGELDRIYDFLGAFGYAMSDTEQQLANGSHPLFEKAKQLKQTS